MFDTREVYVDTDGVLVDSITESNIVTTLALSPASSAALAAAAPLYDYQLMGSVPLAGSRTLGLTGLGMRLPAAPRAAQIIAQPVAQAAPPIVTRSITYTYDGLQRLTDAIETGATTSIYAYGYDLAGNRTSVTTNGVTTIRNYNAANQVIGWSYDAVGNLISDGTSTYAYDALNRVLSNTGTTNTYNGDGTLVAQTVGSVTTSYTQDLAAPLSQILSDGTTTSIYGMERLYGLTGSTRTWYGSDALGSVRQTLNNTGSVIGTANYDPWGQVQSGSVGVFGFTGELQQGNNVYLRARWYNAGSGAFGSRDSFAGRAEQPYSMMPYQYGYSNPILNRDPTGNVVDTPLAETRISLKPTSFNSRALGFTDFDTCTDPLDSATDTLTLDFIDLGIIVGLGLEVTPLFIGAPIGVERVYDLLSFERGTFLIGGAIGSDLTEITPDGLGFGGPNSNAIGMSGGVYWGAFSGLSKYDSWTVGNYAGKSYYIGGGVQLPLDILSIDVSHFFSLDGNVSGWTTGASLGLSPVILPAAAKAGIVNAKLHPRVAEPIHSYRTGGDRWPSAADGEQLIADFEKEWIPPFYAGLRVKQVIRHNAEQWEKLRRWETTRAN